MEVHNERCASISCVLGHIAYGVHVRHKILVFQGEPENGSAHHPAKNGLGRGLQGRQGFPQKYLERQGPTRGVGSTPYSGPSESGSYVPALVGNIDIA